MHLKLKRIAPFQAGKILAALYGLMSLLFVPFFLVPLAFGLLAESQSIEGAPPVPLMFGFGLGFVLLLPIMYAAMGFVTGSLGAWAYNLLAQWIGGFEMEFAAVDAAQPPKL